MRRTASTVQPTRPRPHGGSPKARHGAATPPLITLVTQASNLSELLPQLHGRALAATGGTCALLFEHNARSGALHATSGYGIDALPSEPWIVAPPEASLIGDALSGPTPTLVTEADRQLPELWARLGTRSIWLLPLTKGADRLGLLAIGLERPRREDGTDRETIEVAEAFVTALELFRLRRNEALQRELRGLLDDFAATLSATLNLSAALDAFCRGASRLLGADRTAVWVHDRRARQLVLRATSAGDSDQAMRGARLAADDPRSPVASAMRGTQAELHPPDPGSLSPTVTVPLRGCRRALGAIVFESVRLEPGGELSFLDRADELGRHLSGAIENIQLLDEVVRSRSELENTFDSIADLVVVWDRAGRIVHANQAFAIRVGVARDQLPDRFLAELVGPELGSWLSEAEVPAGGAIVPASLEVIDRVLKGPLLVTVTALRSREQERVGSVLVARDLTTQAKLQAEREELRQRLAQSEKLAALGQFVAGIAHELNNPLQGVLGHLELLKVTGAIPKHLRREVRMIYREADRAAKIVHNLLAFSGSRLMARRSVSLNAVLQRVIAVRAAACETAAIEIVRHYDAKLPRLQSDPLLLHQMFLNIVMNAEHAIAETGRGGRIEITTARSASGDGIVASVRDTGMGIPPDVLPRIFEPFFTTKEVGKGTGLGLAITYGIVQEHNGRIMAGNHSEGGAVFTVELPVRPRSRAARP